MSSPLTTNQPVAHPTASSPSLGLVCLLGGEISSASPTLDAPGPTHPDVESLFLHGNDCQGDESPAPGKLPECEPTCDNPRPPCLRIFYSSLDMVACFCKQPLVRNKLTNKCVRLEECPSKKLNLIGQ